MARKPNKDRPKPTKVATSATMRAYLEDIAATGLYGDTAAEVAERLIGQGITRLIEQRVISLRTPPPNVDSG